jgi:hypothetical protein
MSLGGVTTLGPVLLLFRNLVGDFIVPSPIYPFPNVLLSVTRLMAPGSLVQDQACKFVCLEETCLSSLEYRCRRPVAISSTSEMVLACERDDGLPLNRETRITSKNIWKWQRARVAFVSVVERLKTLKVEGGEMVIPKFVLSFC